MRVAFRVDASREMGIGHLMRCLALADALKQGGAGTRFVCRDLPRPLREIVLRSGHDLRELSAKSRRPDSDSPSRTRVVRVSQSQDAQDTTQALSDESWDWLVVDHYELDARWESGLHAAVPRLLVVDDLADRNHDCDLLLDQNLYADMETRYRDRVPATCQRLLGPRFALLRQEFGVWRERVKHRSDSVKRLLVCFGGADWDDNTGLAIEALAGLGADLSVDVVIGAAHSHRDQVEGACLRLGFTCHVQTTRMAELMASADLAIGGGGVTTWERCCLGLPALVVSVAENQDKQVRHAAVEGLVYTPDLPPSGISASLVARHTQVLLENAALREAMSRRGMEVVDGCGVSRVCREVGARDIELREASQEDAASLFEWRNHPSIRAVSGNREPLDWQSHQQWLRSVLHDPDRVLLIGEREGSAVGVLRFDIQRHVAEVSIYLVPGMHARGTGSQLLHAAERWLVSSRSDVRCCRARVIGDNRPSHGLFAGAGYEVESLWYSKRLSPE